MIEAITLKIIFLAKSKEEAQIVHDSLEPDNLATPPVRITSEYSDKIVKVEIEGITNLNTASATLIDLLDSYDLNDQILRKIEKSV